MPVQDDDADGASDRRSMLPDLILGRVAPADMLAEVVTLLHSTDEPDATLCSQVGCGDLESLLREHETTLWPEVEHLARTDVRFRRALSAAWAYDSPEFERRVALLAELGEQREVTVRFTVEPEDFSPDPALSWRAFEVEGGITNRRLAETFRDLAEWLDNRNPDADAGRG